MPSRTWPCWASGKGGPLATDQLAVPAEQVSGLSSRASEPDRHKSRRKAASRRRSAVGCRKSIRTQRRSSKAGCDQPPSMLLFVLNACLRLLIDLAIAPFCDRAADQDEPLVLRHQVRVLERNLKVVRWRKADRLVLGALACRLPRGAVTLPGSPPCAARRYPGEETAEAVAALRAAVRPRPLEDPARSGGSCAHRRKVGGGCIS